MTDLTKKIKELEAKHKEILKAEKAKLMEKYRAEQKKLKQEQEKQFTMQLIKFRKLINNDAVLLGGLVRTLELVENGEQEKISQLQDLSKKHIE